ncbi:MULTISPECIES: YibE/F family protein [Corynebacterium]|uniref:YibE/F family protein n=1 Tax=Corynebacterium TaxID=1716 RepID=UPI0008A2C59D|nr:MULTISPECIES: YibE/F family protein [Corynebacterium]OFO43283.1 YibE/F family protein [Corynebacterium sp. HMSC073D01]QQU88769.1 YibE/F family protein [Corynebacterium glucuronolyticum]
MAKHGHQDSRRSGFTGAQLALLVFIGISTLLTLIGLAAYWPPSTAPAINESFTANFALNQDYVPGTVTTVDEGGCPPPNDTGCKRNTVAITGGPNEGISTQLVTHDVAGEPQLNVGDKILLTQTATPDGYTYAFGDYQRAIPLAIWGIVIGLAIIALAAWYGLRSLIGLTYSLGVVVVFLVPALLHGEPAIPLAVTAVSAIIIVSVPLVHGLNWKSASALSGTLLSILVTAVLATWAIGTTNLRGLGDDENLNLVLYLPEVQILGVMLCGFIIGAVGGLNDVTVAQASTVQELSAADPGARPWSLFTSAMKVGRDHVSSMTYTLVLTYTGTALPMLLLQSVSSRSAGLILTGDQVATELLRSGTGALAIVCAVPLTTFIAALVIPARKKSLHYDKSKQWLNHAQRTTHSE